MPRRSDQLIITCDAATSLSSIAAVLYIKRNGTILNGGYFSSKLSIHRSKWEPCELEAFAISSSVHHWSHYITQSTSVMQILTDSKPCIQAWHRMQKGQFSSSQRVSTFLATLSRYNVHPQHISGSSNFASDFLSRHPVVCSSGKCQICKFIDLSSDTPIRFVSTEDVLNGNQSMPFLNRAVTYVGLFLTFNKALSLRESKGT